MIVTPWETMTCADDSHEWEPIHTGPTDARSTIAERGLFDFRGCVRCRTQQQRFRVPESPEDGELLIAEERERRKRILAGQRETLKELERDLK